MLAVSNLYLSSIETLHLKTIVYPLINPAKNEQIISPKDDTEILSEAGTRVPVINVKKSVN